MNAPYIFLHKRVYENAKVTRILERMLRGLGYPGFEEVGDDDLWRVAESAGMSEAQPVMSGRVRQGIEKRSDDPVLLFNTFVWDETKRSKRKRVYRNPRLSLLDSLLRSVGEDFAFSKREANYMHPRPFVCQGGWGIHSLTGCVHRCDYCGQSYFVNLMLDLEEFAERSRSFSRRDHSKNSIVMISEAMHCASSQSMVHRRFYRGSSLAQGTGICFATPRATMWGIYSIFRSQTQSSI